MQACFFFSQLQKPYTSINQYEDFRSDRDKIIDQSGQNVSCDIKFFKQTIGNTCGTIGLYHCLANSPKYVKILEGPFKSYLKACEGKSLEEKAKLMEDNKNLKDIHSKNAQSGQTDAPTAEDDVDLHFISFVEVDGDIYEMDGVSS